VQIRLARCPQEVNLKSESPVRRMVSATDAGRYKPYKKEEDKI